MKKHLGLLSIPLLLIMHHAALGAQRSTDCAKPACVNGFPIAVLQGDQCAPAIVSDGAGGFIVAWQDDRFNVVPKVYVQRLDPTGAPLWPDGGVNVSLDTTCQLAPRIVPDLNGGAVIEWQDDNFVSVTTPGGTYPVEYTRSFSAQRIDASGNRLWGDKGTVILVVNETFDPYALNMNARAISGIAADGANGAYFLVWDFNWFSSHSYSDLKLGRIGSSGSVLWSDVVVALSHETLPFSHGTIVADGAAGAIVSWTYATDGTHPDLNYGKLAAARFNGSGNMVWSTSPLADDSQQAIFSYDACPDDSGGVYLCWDGAYSNPAATTAERNIMVQRIDADGLRRWGGSGLTMCSAPGLQTNPLISTIPGGGAIAAWQDFRSSASVGDLYALRVDAKGNLPWPANGVAVCHSDSTPAVRGITCDPHGVSTIVWADLRHDAPGLYAQSLGAAGRIRWQSGGSPVVTNIPSIGQSAVAANTSFRAFVVWQDKRNGTDFDIYGVYADHNAELQAGSLAVTVQNAPAFGAPGSNVNVALYDRSNVLLQARNTDLNGMARFDSVMADTAYSISVSDVPNTPDRLFGREYWGSKSGLAVDVGDTTAVTFQRNMPYTSNIVVYNAETNQPLSGGVPFGTEARVSIEITNPDVPGSTQQKVRCSLVLDRDKQPAYDFIDTSLAQTIAVGAKQTFDFTLLPSDSGAYFHVAGAQTELSGSYVQTEGGMWGSIPALVVNPPPPGGVLITVRTDPAGRTFVVDDSTYTGARNFVWITGSHHTIGAPSPQSPSSWMRYRWVQWSDGDTLLHAVTTPAGRATYIATFDTAYYLAATAGNGGSVHPASGWFKSGSSVLITATPSIGWRFVRWVGAGPGSYSGADTVASVVMDSAITESATFESTTGIAGLPGGIPTVFSLDGNYPNPFNPTTMIRFGIPTRSRVQLVVYSILGQRVAELINGDIEAGYHDVRFDCGNLASGTYIYRLTAPGFSQTKKLVLTK